MGCSTQDADMHLLLSRARAVAQPGPGTQLRVTRADRRLRRHGGAQHIQVIQAYPSDLPCLAAVTANRPGGVC